MPETAQSSKAASFIKQMNTGGEEEQSIVLVFNSGSDKALSDPQKNEINHVLRKLQQQKSQLGLKDLVTYLDGEEQAKRLVSEDGTTILTQISFVLNEDRPIEQITSDLDQMVRISDVPTYLTGSTLVTNDFSKSVEEGVKKTETIAIIFILVILIIVFRSPIIPLISLLTVGISYLVSLAIIGHLVDSFNYPFSNFTQVFLVVVLFGIGTDYNILLYTRFKEELNKQGDVLEAVKVTFKTAGKTVLFSGLAVFIGFLTLLLAKFGLYRSSSAVAVGVAVLIIVLNTLNPFFMVLMGKRMFWPSKSFSGHADSRLWGWLSSRSALRPLLSLLIVAIISVPLIMGYSKQLAYDDLAEVADSYESKQGINVIADHFAPGFSAPVTLAIRSDEPLDNQESLKVLDELSDKISKVKGVSKVYSVTRPTGARIDDLYINDQTGKVNEGVGEANGGVDTIKNGLSSVTDQLKSTDDLSNVQQLIAGTGQLQEGTKTLEQAMNQVTAGLNDGTSGAEELSQGLASLKANVQKLQAGTAQLKQGYARLEQGLGSFGNFFTTVKTAVKGAMDGYAQIQTSMSAITATHPEMAEDVEVQKVMGITASAQKQLNELYSQIDPLTAQYNSAMDSFKQANGSLGQISDGLGQVVNGAGQLQKGADQLTTGLGQGAKGSAQIADKTSDVASGLDQLGKGQQQLYTGLQELQGKMNDLKDGLTQSTEGLSSISEGLNSASRYLAGLSRSEASESFYIPDDVLHGAEFQQSLDTYMSGNRKIAEISIILDDNPYSKEAMNVVQDLNGQLDSALKGTKLEKADLALGGVTQQNLDLKDIAGGDFNRTSAIMLIGIGIMLILITRSFWPPVFVIGSLYLTYLITLGANEFISKQLVQVDDLSWNVPFFTFIMIVTLGVDYSIFLLMRYREIEASPTEAIKQASRNLGGVVISAAIILGGTFAALIPSGVITLIEVAIGVMIGLVLLSLIMLPVLFPALMNLLDRAGRFSRKEKEANAEQQEDNNSITG
ncbi:membrane protein [Paenibacillus physcomitrellae]|uniref:Membrane protein n=2 Tax=Paenibacillus physcomitrellae TaxID=1619311 RepID=A0ABQ1FTW8_9BACL|nr:membrane protein [Paenibacillus physcomitrellae]